MMKFGNDQQKNRAKEDFLNYLQKQTYQSGTRKAFEIIKFISEIDH
ncbi:unnamed protein product [Paramecium sonneborni]|uniref:Uncharacterized protein n=1 Tax=Paramecium sonneborni TaxID=65129 RepID=A0A8S1PMU0_9CILI|nr:unnamed protein product [Paramecium sonneborni]